MHTHFQVLYLHFSFAILHTIGMSTTGMTAAMIMAASEAFGMKWNALLSSHRASSTMVPRGQGGGMEMTDAGIGREEGDGGGGVNRQMRRLGEKAKGREDENTEWLTAGQEEEEMGR
jgi:hypothetical protein